MDVYSAHVTTSFSCVIFLEHRNPSFARNIWSEWRVRVPRTIQFSVRPAEKVMQLNEWIMSHNMSCSWSCSSCQLSTYGANRACSSHFMNIEAATTTNTLYNVHMRQHTTKRTTVVWFVVEFVFWPKRCWSTKQYFPSKIRQFLIKN